MGLERMERILRDLGNPHKNLPPIIHVAGTNGKGSTTAFLRAIAAAAGLSCHVMTSPHLVRFNERFVVAGEEIDDAFLLEVLEETESRNRGQDATFFELITAAGFLAFSKRNADLCLLEVGMGGRLDGTNVIENPLATAITSISFDHTQHLGNTLALIATEKAGIMKPGAPCIVGPQDVHGMSDHVLDVFIKRGEELNAPVLAWSRDWTHEQRGKNLWVRDAYGDITLPAPSLPGLHQYGNAATAVVTLRHLAQAQCLKLNDTSFVKGIQTARWPARLQNLNGGKLSSLLPQGWDLWLDGGHNDSAGEILSEQARAWAAQDGLPLHVVLGMINTKDPAGFLKPLMPHLSGIVTIPIADHHLTLSAEALAQAAQSLTSRPIRTAPDVSAALSSFTRNDSAPARVLVTGSLYLAGTVLKANL